MATAMAGVPRALARKMESKSVMAVINKRIMAPMLKGNFRNSSSPQPGFTKNLFKDQKKKQEAKWALPTHLAGVEAAGSERALAVARLVRLVENLYEKSVKDIVSKEVLEFVDAETSVRILNSQTFQRAGDLEKKLTVFQGKEKDKVVAMAILLASTNPHRLYRTSERKALMKQVGVGVKNARLLIVWWSMRLTLKRAKGLEAF